MMPQPFIYWDINNLSTRLKYLGFNTINIWVIKRVEDYNEKICIKWRDTLWNYVITLNIEQLFKNPTFIHLYLAEDKHRSLNNFMYFNNINWFEVVLAFKKSGIILSGGSNTKRHILSTTDYRLD
jgi:hypothetical protein